MIVGTEWLIEAQGCDQDKLRDESVLRDVFARVIDDLGLKAIDSVWHKFEGEGGVTGMVALTESHLACHTYPEYEIATFNLYCCRTRPEWDWEGNLTNALGADAVRVTKFERGQYTASNIRSEILDPKSHTAGGDA
jgi:S-adenosylmethionine decarboxylase